MVVIGIALPKGYANFLVKICSGFGSSACKASLERLFKISFLNYYFDLFLCWYGLFNRLYPL